MEPVDDILGIGCPETVFDTRILLPEAGNPGRQIRGADRLDGADVKLAALPVMDGAHLILHLMEQIQDLLGLLANVSAFFRDMQPSLLPDKQLNTQVFFQAVQLPCQMRLGNMKFPRCSGDILVFSNF